MAQSKKDEINLADVQAQVAAMLAEAKAEAEKIIAEAKIGAGVSKTPEQEEAERRRKEIMAEDEEYVEVKLFKDNNKYKDDVPVGCNGEVTLIKRGERVKVKRKIAKILDNSEHQDYETAMLIEQKTGEAARMDL